MHIYIGHAPRGTKQHLVRTHQGSPAGRTKASLCGTQVKVVRLIDDLERVNSLLCYACRISMRDEEWA